MNYFLFFSFLFIQNGWRQSSQNRTHIINKINKHPSNHLHFLHPFLNKSTTAHAHKSKNIRHVTLVACLTCLYAVFQLKEIAWYYELSFRNEFRHYFISKMLQRTQVCEKYRGQLSYRIIWLDFSILVSFYTILYYSFWERLHLNLKHFQCLEPSSGVLKWRLLKFRFL